MKRALEKQFCVAIAMMSVALFACGKTDKTAGASTAATSEDAAVTSSSESGTSESFIASAAVSEKEPEYIEKTIQEFSYKIPADWVTEENDQNRYHPADSEDSLFSTHYHDTDYSVNDHSVREAILSDLQSNGDSDGYSYSDGLLSGDKDIAGQTSFALTDTVTKNGTKYNYSGIAFDCDGGVIWIDWYVPADAENQYSKEFDSIISSISRTESNGYTVENYEGLTFKVPKTWNAKGAGSDVYTNFVYSIDKTYVLIGTREMKSKLVIDDSNAEKEKDAFTQNFQKNGNCADLTSGVKDIAGKKSIVIQCKMADENSNQDDKYKYVIIPNNMETIDFILIYPVDAANTHEAEFDALVDSITLSDENAESSSSAATMKESSSTAKTKAASASDEVTPSFKEMMDSYEAFIDEYVDFMQKYKANPNDATLISEYTEYMTKYADLMKKLDAIDEKSLSKADYAYYVDAYARITKKLLTVAQ